MQAKKQQQQQQQYLHRRVRSACSVLPPLCASAAGPVPCRLQQQRRQGLLRHHSRNLRGSAEGCDTPLLQIRCKHPSMLEETRLSKALNHPFPASTTHPFFCPCPLASTSLPQGPVKDLNKLQAARRAVGFERSPDGRVLLLTEDGEPFQVKNDMGVPGLLLLRCALGGGLGGGLDDAADLLIFDSNASCCAALGLCMGLRYHQ